MEEEKVKGSRIKIGMGAEEDYPLMGDNKSEDMVFDYKSLSETSIRVGFIRKVYIILLTQIIFTALLIFMGLKFKNYRKFLLTHVYLFYIAIAINLVTFYILIYSKTLQRKVPTNFILLSIFTLTEGFFISYITSLTDPKIVFIAAVLTTLIVLSLTIYAFTTKTDFTLMGGFLFVICAALIGLGILTIFFRSQFLNIVYCSLGVIVFGLYLIFDTQMLMGNKRNMFSIDDYILAALMIYLDVINLFLEILRLLNNGR